MLKRGETPLHHYPVPRTKYRRNSRAPCRRYDCHPEFNAHARQAVSDGLSVDASQQYHTVSSRFPPLWKSQGRWGEDANADPKARGSSTGGFKNPTPSDRFGPQEPDTRQGKQQKHAFQASCPAIDGLSAIVLDAQESSLVYFSLDVQFLLFHNHQWQRNVVISFEACSAGIAIRIPVSRANGERRSVQRSLMNEMDPGLATNNARESGAIGSLMK
ncbi:hypothetical protein CVT24_001192 [Panaeolus cyanescens]|uniref:Uncharacterized protein n=1 Tax=Panaeolus cyanescens TaxID=181874 RepID=A0A409W6U2_9AGAR|nr:hypothetical protein CVT24_001192 [Panaeolus cyanescens]